MSERFSITWMNGAYYVSIPNYEGGEVVKAEAYDTLTTQRDMLVKALEGLDDVIQDLGHTLSTDFDFWNGIHDDRRIPVYTAWSFLNELHRLSRQALSQTKEGV